MLQGVHREGIDPTVPEIQAVVFRDLVPEICRLDHVCPTVRPVLWTPYLTDDFEFSKAKEMYLKYNPDKAKFMERLVWPYFKIGLSPTVPVSAGLRYAY